LDDLLKIRDPFRRVIKVDEKSDTRTLSELEQFPIEEFKMVGVITGPKRIRAMLRSPNGGTHFVAINQKVGTRNGRVVRITSDYVEVVEKISNILGRTETVTQKIEISPEFQTQ
jgi:Tfp pilus assembly protein PilP